MSHRVESGVTGGRSSGQNRAGTVVNISLIIPAFNEAKLLGNSLLKIRAATAAFTERGWASELIVCDNNSTDRTAELARAEGATVVFEPVNQISRARNRGAAVAQGDWLIFIDADSHPSRELLSEVAGRIESGHCLAGGVTVRLDRPTLMSRVWLGAWNAISRVTQWPAGSFIFCEAAAFRALSGFSERLFVAEEIDFGRRLKRLARERGLDVVILRQHPVLTSARKLELYSLGEMARFVFRSVWAGGATFKDRAACAPWYNGRR
ncbi:MAG: glycosyltransferase [Verrucomicrobia bacterium]|nr:glycosyltransferase [Verrucomicrobiota bacterium]